MSTWTGNGKRDRQMQAGRLLGLPVMVNSTMTIETLEDPFVYHLEEMYFVENRLVEVLGDLATDAGNEKLQRGFEDHQEVLEALVKEREAFHELQGLSQGSKLKSMVSRLMS